ncbi:MAG: hypothetical protein AABX51_04985, partial [Nanoarchaeota archaeon]
MKTYNDLKTDASQNIVNRLVWCTAQKDQAGIASDLASGKDIPEVYGLGAAGLFDEFFYFLSTLKISNLFNGLDPKLTKRRSNINFHSVLLTYIIRIVSGLPFYWHIEPILLKSQSLMRLVGFNGTQVRDGTCNRGITSKTTDKVQDTQHAQNTQGAQDVQDTQNNSTQIRGPICADSIAAYIEAIPASALERFFNGVISILAANSFFP